MSSPGASGTLVSYVFLVASKVVGATMSTGSGSTRLTGCLTEVTGLAPKSRGFVGPVKVQEAFVVANG